MLAALTERGALLEGHFRLSSGRHSDRFIQKFRILEDPAQLEPLARAIADAFRAVRPTVVVSAAVGGIVLGTKWRAHLHVKAIFVEKEHGVPVLRRNFSLGRDDRALIVEDVVTTGLSVREVIDVVRAHGAQVAGVGVIVMRGETRFRRADARAARLPDRIARSGALSAVRRRTADRRSRIAAFVSVAVRRAASATDRAFVEDLGRRSAPSSISSLRPAPERPPRSPTNGCWKRSRRNRTWCSSPNATAGGPVSRCCSTTFPTT